MTIGSATISYSCGWQPQVTYKLKYIGGKYFSTFIDISRYFGQSTQSDQTLKIA